jgi:protein gp37
MKEEWVKNFINDCSKHNIPFLFKQWGEYAPVNGVMTLVGVDTAGDLIDGINYAEYPVVESTMVEKKKLTI